MVDLVLRYGDRILGVLSCYDRVMFPILSVGANPGKSVQRERETLTAWRQDLFMKAHEPQSGASWMARNHVHVMMPARSRTRLRRKEIRCPW